MRIPSGGMFKNRNLSLRARSAKRSQKLTTAETASLRSQ